MQITNKQKLDAESAQEAAYRRIEGMRGRYQTALRSLKGHQLDTPTQMYVDSYDSEARVKLMHAREAVTGGTTRRSRTERLLYKASKAVSRFETAVQGTIDQSNAAVADRHTKMDFAEWVQQG